MSVAAVTQRLKAGETLRPGDMTSFMGELMDGRLAEDDICAFLTALRARGETVADIVEAARVMRSRCTPLPGAVRKGLLDTCGTGGDGLHTMNVSTLAALTAAAAGGKVAKHGNRAVSGHFGSADLLERLGVRIDLPPDAVARCIEETGFGFIFAPLYHPAMKHAAGARKRIQGRTLFNCLGPLTNPAGADRQLVGVYDAKLVSPVCEALGMLGAERVIVVHGSGGMDEVAPSGETLAAEWARGRMETFTVRPEELGVRPAEPGALRCSTAEDSLRLAREALEGKPGAALEFTALNAAFALRAAGIAEDFRRAAETARGLLLEKRVLAKLEQVRSFRP